MSKPDYPKGAVRSIKEAQRLIAKAKRTGKSIPVFLYWSNDASYIPRVITPESTLDKRGSINYFSLKGSDANSGPEYLGREIDESGRRIYLFTNYWFAYAYALRSGFHKLERMHF